MAKKVDVIAVVHYLIKMKVRHVVHLMLRATSKVRVMENKHVYYSLMTISMVNHCVQM